MRRAIIFTNWSFHGMIHANLLYICKGIYEEIQIDSTLSEFPDEKQALDDCSNDNYKYLLRLY